MYEKICCIYDADENYAMRLSEAMNSNGAFPLRVMAFTSKDALLECMTDYDIELLLVDEQMDKEVRDEFPSTKYIVISEGDSDLERNIISRYQSTERIIRQIVYKLGTGNGEMHTTYRTGITSFYSPSGMWAKSLLALAYAHTKGMERKVLYINLDEFSGLRELFQESEKGLSDAIYYYYVRKENALEGIIGCIGSNYGFDYLGPVSCPDDIGDLSDEDLIKMIEMLRGSRIYDEIVLDMGNLIRKPWSIMAESGRVYIPVSSKQGDVLKRLEFSEYIEKKNLHKIKSVIKEVACESIVSDNNLPLKTFVTSRNMEAVIGGL